MREQLAQYCLWLQEQELSPHSKRAYSTHVRAFFDFCDGSNDPFEQVQNYAKHLQTEAAKPATINTKLTAIAHFARFCGRDNFQIDREPMNSDSQEIHALNEDEEAALVDLVGQSNSKRDKAIFMLLLYTGIRPRECCAAELSSIDLIAGTGTFSSKKSGKVRVVALHPALKSALAAWLAERRPPVGADANALFVTQGGWRISTSVVDNVVRKFGLQARLVVSARTIRNTFLRKLAASGASARALAKVGGHRRPGLVKRYFEQVPLPQPMVMSIPAQVPMIRS